MVKLTPAMGWNSWNTFGENINEDVVKETADAMVETGLKDAGYEYVVIDDCWSLRERDEKGRLVADPNKFPHGMNYLSDYVHSKGLKFGMYSCAGALTCASYPGSYEYEFTDAQTFAEWGVDFLKYDYCFRSGFVPGDVLYKRMGTALANCGRDILFSACSWGADDTHVWIKETGANMWRSTGDISDNWNRIRSLIQEQIQRLEYNGQGCFNDIDMLVVGMNGKGNVACGGCTEDEYMTHFAFWCFFGSPLIIGCDVRDMSDSTKAILMNKELIRINQDTAYRQPYFLPTQSRYFKKNYNRKTDEPYLSSYPTDVPIMAKLLDDGSIAIGVFNLTDYDTSPWNSTVLTDSLGVPVSSGKALLIHDIFTGEEFTAKSGFISLPCKAHCSRVLKATVIDA